MNQLPTTIKAVALLAAALACTAGHIQAQAATPPGLQIGSRTLTRHTQYTKFNAINVSALAHGSPSTAALWVESPGSSEVATGNGQAVIPFDLPLAADAVQSVTVHDAYGSVVTIQTRQYALTPGSAKTVRLAVEVDKAGRLLPLPTVRAVWDKAAGTVTVTRDNAFAEDLEVHYRTFDLHLDANASPIAATVTIPAGASSVVLPVTPQFKTAVILYAGKGYTTAPGENSDLVQFE